MIVTATEFKKNLGKFLEMSLEEEILITKNGKIIAQLSQPNAEKLAILRTLVGFAKEENLPLSVIKDERLSRK